VSERGRYRSITTALINGPDYQRLTANARLVLLTMKISFGPAGIELKYPSVLHEELRHQTGLVTKSLAAALAELERERWIQRSSNVVWITEQLRYEPQLHSNNPKHVAGVRQHVLGLPRIPIVEKFRRHYAEYFPVQAIEGLSIANGKATDTLSSDAVMPIDSQSIQREGERDRERDGEGKPSRPRARKPREPKPEPTWVQVLYDVWIDKVGAVTHGQLGKALKPLVDKYGVDALVPAIDVYGSADEGPRGPRSVVYFAQNCKHWIRIAETPLSQDGVLTDRGRRIMGGGAA
jgi:hypothetical protein